MIFVIWHFILKQFRALFSFNVIIAFGFATAPAPISVSQRSVSAFWSVISSRLRTCFKEGEEPKWLLFWATWITVRVYTARPTKAEANPANLHNAQGPVYMGYTHRGPQSRPPSVSDRTHVFLFSLCRIKGKASQWAVVPSVEQQSRRRWAEEEEEEEGKKKTRGGKTCTLFLSHHSSHVCIFFSSSYDLQICICVVLRGHIGGSNGF